MPGRRAAAGSAAPRRTTEGSRWAGAAGVLAALALGGPAAVGAPPALAQGGPAGSGAEAGGVAVPAPAGGGRRSPGGSAGGAGGGTGPAGAGARGAAPEGAGARGAGGAAPADAGDRTEGHAAPTRELPRGPARLTALVCVRGCAPSGAARPGALLRVRGRGIAGALSVVFEGAAGDADDVIVRPLKRRRHSVDVQVPRLAVAGPVSVVDAHGARSPAAPTPLAIEPPPPATMSAGAPAVEVEVAGHTVFFDATRPARLSYLVRGAAPASVAVELVRAQDGQVIRRWAAGPVAPGEPQSLTWDGTAGGRVQREGRYEFRVVAHDASGARALSAATTSADEPGPGSFEFLRHQFPVQGPHDFGEGAAAFGGGRGHQGQDVFADCGTPIVAARGGTVKFKQFHSRAGHYIVIDGARTGMDYAYMHLRDAALVAAGERVRTGQLVGYVGATGRASGCHLHFEIWRAPGWYSGGQPLDPLPQLRAWAAAS